MIVQIPSIPNIEVLVVIEIKSCCTWFRTSYWIFVHFPNNVCLLFHFHTDSLPQKQWSLFFLAKSACEKQRNVSTAFSKCTRGRIPHFSSSCERKGSHVPASGKVPLHIFRDWSWKWTEKIDNVFNSRASPCCKVSDGFVANGWVHTRDSRNTVQWWSTLTKSKWRTRMAQTTHFLSDAPSGTRWLKGTTAWSNDAFRNVSQTERD